MIRAWPTEPSFRCARLRRCAVPRSLICEHGGTRSRLAAAARLRAGLLADTVESVDHVKQGAAVIEVDRDEVGDVFPLVFAFLCSGEQQIAGVDLVGRLNRAWAPGQPVIEQEQAALRSASVGRAVEGAH